MEIRTFFDFCSGIGGGRLGLEQIGLKCVGYSDTARLAPITYNLMHDATEEKNFGNLKRIKTEIRRQDYILWRFRQLKHP